MRKLFALTIVLVACPVVAHSTEYLPLAVGNGWSYATVEGSSELQTVIGTTTVWGSSTFVIGYTASTFNDGP